MPHGYNYLKNIKSKNPLEPIMDWSIGSIVARAAMGLVIGLMVDAVVALIVFLQMKNMVNSFEHWDVLIKFFWVFPLALSNFSIFFLKQVIWVVDIVRGVVSDGVKN